MKRFSAHYLWHPRSGFLKQQVVEIEAGRVSNVFPLTEEIEAVEWLPGVIVLSPTDSATEHAIRRMFQEGPTDKENLDEAYFSYWLHPFDFTSMKPVAETRHKLLR